MHAVGQKVLPLRFLVLLSGYKSNAAASSISHAAD
jgi:hypothetical protein